MAGTQIPSGRRNTAAPRGVVGEEKVRHFAAQVRRKFSGSVRGNAEEQLRAPVETLLNAAAGDFGLDATVTGEIPLAGQLGRPDFGLLVQGVLVGYVELKSPSTSVLPGSFRGRDKEQFVRFAQLPNVLYTNGTQWVLYRNGTLALPPVEFSGQVEAVGEDCIDAEAVRALSALLRAFAFWQPISPRSAPELASVLAPLCHLLRTEVLDSLRNPQSPLVGLSVSWRQLLFPDATDFQFADAYAQTITFALLLARAEGADTLNLSNAITKLELHHSLLSRALVVLTDTQIQNEISTALRLIQVVVSAVTPDLMRAKKSDPWLYFYEDFLGAYDPELRRQAGVYYTPSELVTAQTALVQDILINRLSQPHGFAGESVRVLDPALGTGTFLLKALDLAVERVTATEGEGAVEGHLATLARNLIGFELMVGPYAVSELRLAQAFLSHANGASAKLPRIYLTDTLESPHSEPVALPLFLKPISQQHEAALRVKETESIVVCIGNPPYDYHKSADAQTRGGWVVSGDDHSDTAIFQSFLQPAQEAGFGIHAKHLYDSYVFFWRWALWKVFEHRTSPAAGIVAFVTASSYLGGKAFVGMREHMRHRCDEIWVIDLGGGSRGARKSQNVFAIRSAVAICIAVRYTGHRGGSPARVNYTRIDGTAGEKLRRLGQVKQLTDLTWAQAPSDWQAPFKPVGVSDFFDWPLITDLFPWHVSGAQFKRTWPIGATRELLERRWVALLNSPDRATAFKESRDRKIAKEYAGLGTPARQRPIGNLQNDTPPPPICRYSYRSFDRQWAFADNRVGDYLRASLWATASDRQVFLTSLLTKELGEGMAATVAGYVPDMDHFCNRGARDVIPMWKDAGATTPNVSTGLLDRLSDALGHPVGHEDLFCYVYAVLGTPWYCDRFFDELASPEIRVPITTDPELFGSIRDRGRRLVWLHTFGERMACEGSPGGPLPRGVARCMTAVSTDPERYPESFSYDAEERVLSIGDGAFAPVDPDVWEFSISGFRVLQSWIGYRLRDRKGKKTSPLDRLAQESWTAQMTTELLELLWVLEASSLAFEEIAPLLDRIVEGPLLNASDLPQPTPADRASPAQGEEDVDLFAASK
jgi:hypothetical protein